jgi:hypothetical protein
LAQQAEHIAYGHGKRTTVGGFVRGLVTQERDLQRTPARRGQLTDHHVEDGVEQVAEPCVGEPALGLGRTRGEHGQPTPARRRDSGEPQRRLPDPGLALEHQRRRRGGGTVEEANDGAELRIAPDDPDAAHAPILTAPRTEVSSPKRNAGHRCRAALHRNRPNRNVRGQPVDSAACPTTQTGTDRNAGPPGVPHPGHQ